MGGLSAFMSGNVQKIENKKIVVSERFRDESGTVIPWEIRCMPADEYAAIRSECVKYVPAGKGGKLTAQPDARAFQARVAAACTVFPDLNNRELQESWGVMRPEELLGRLLNAGEFDDYVTEVFRLNGFKDEADLVEEAKN